MRMSCKEVETIWFLDTWFIYHMTGRLDDLRHVPLVFVKKARFDWRHIFSYGMCTMWKGSTRTWYHLVNLSLIIFLLGKLLIDLWFCRTAPQGCWLERVSVRVRDCITSEVLRQWLRFTRVGDECALWHHHLGHPSSRVVGLALGVSFKANSTFCFKNCDLCLCSKQTLNFFSDSYNKATTSFELIHCDLWGPYQTSAFCGSRYFLTIVDDYSHAVWLYLLPNKVEVLARLHEFVALFNANLNIS